MHCNERMLDLLARFTDALVAGVGEVMTGDGVRTTRRLTPGCRRPQTARVNPLTSPTDDTRQLTTASLSK